MNVLVVDDDLLIRGMAVAELEEAGHKVMDAASGGQAIRHLQTGIAVDVLLTDMRMPEANGWSIPPAFSRSPGRVFDRLCGADAACHGRYDTLQTIQNVSGGGPP